MPRSYSLTDGARLLGVSIATLSRRLPPDRVSRGRSARLSLRELIGVARQVNVDPELVRRKAGLIEFGPGMPVPARFWAEIAAERELAKALAEHVKRIPDGLLQLQLDPLAEFVIPEPWGEAAKWRPIGSKEELDALAPPANE